jgi:Chaperone of endosialidase
MANAWYPIYKQNLLAGTAGYDLDNNTSADGPYCALVDTGVYTYNNAHQFYDAGGASDVIDAKVGTDQRISTPTVVSGTFDGDDLTFLAVSGASVEALVIYRHNSGASTTWPLVLYLDNTAVTGLPVTPNGGNITITWSGSGISTISDARAKQDIRQVGRSANGLNVYEFRYNGQKRLRRGLIAQEVAESRPWAVTSWNGLLAVDYERALAA